MSDHLIFIDFGFFTIYWYGVWIGFAVLLASLLFAVLRRKQGAEWSDSLDTAMFSLPAALIGARVFYCWFAQASFPNGLKDYLNLAEGGYALYGALLGVVTVLVIRSVRRKEELLMTADAAAVSVAGAIAVGRFASRLCGSDISGLMLSGTRSDNLPFVIWSEAEQSNILWVGFWEGISGLLTMLVSGMVFAKTYGRKPAGFQKGNSLLIALTMYGMTQTYWESMRNDSLFMVTLGFVRISQIISFVIALTALIIIIVKGCRPEKPHSSDIFLWVLCEAATAAAIYCEVRMNATSVVRNYLIMGISLLSMIIVALYYLSRSTARRTAGEQKVPAEPEALPSAAAPIAALPPYVALRDRFRQTSGSGDDTSAADDTPAVEETASEKETAQPDIPPLPLAPEEILPIEIAEEPIN